MGLKTSSFLEVYAAQMEIIHWCLIVLAALVLLGLSRLSRNFLLRAGLLVYRHNHHSGVTSKSDHELISILLGCV